MSDYDMSDNEETAPRPKLDKGKGKMKYLPILPPEVWKRVYELYYDMVCEGGSVSSYQDSLFITTPP